MAQRKEESKFSQSLALRHKKVNVSESVEKIAAPYGVKEWKDLKTNYEAFAHQKVKMGSQISSAHILLIMSAAIIGIGLTTTIVLFITYLTTKPDKRTIKENIKGADLIVLGSSQVSSDSRSLAGKNTDSLIDNSIKVEKNRKEMPSLP